MLLRRSTFSISRTHQLEDNNNTQYVRVEVCRTMPSDTVLLC